MVAIVSSASAFVNVKSEQWKPSPSAIGCNAVLVKLVPSAEMVASRHGSSRRHRHQSFAYILDWEIGESHFFR